MLTRTAALALVLSAASASAPSAAQRAPRGPRRTCVQFTQHTAEDRQSTTFEIVNRCPMTVEGTLRWSVACGESGAGTPEEHLEPVRPGQSRILVASAAACGGAGVWRIEGVSWSWRPAAADGAGP